MYVKTQAQRSGVGTTLPGEAENDGALAFHARSPAEAAFIAQWRDFRERRRTAPVMVSLAEELSEQEVNDLADHYAALVPPSALQANEGWTRVLRRRAIIKTRP